MPQSAFHLRAIQVLGCVALACGIAACSKPPPAPASTVNVDKLAEKTQRLWDAHEVANLMGLYVHFNRNGLDADTVGLFAVDDAEIAVEFPGEGRYVGKDEVAKRLTWNERMRRAGKVEFYGRFGEQMLTSPIIVVADDGQTAKALWSRQGYEAVNTARDPHRPNIATLVTTGKYAVDFKKVGDQWKIWHLHVYPTWSSLDGKAWTQPSDKSATLSARSKITIAEAASAAQKPTAKEVGLVAPRASRDNEPFWSYSQTQPYPPREQPRAPRPYANWAATFSY